MQSRKNGNFFILTMLGALSMISPFAIDMYLPAFPQMAGSLGTSDASIALSMSSYFIGLALGQVIYGPLLDRFGRKKPLYVGLLMFIASSIACSFAHNIEMLIGLRFLQALGGGIGQTGAVTMVHDFFPIEASAKIFSMLFLFIGVSPLFAPSTGTLVVGYFGWQWIFILLGSIVALILTVIFFFLPEGHQADKSISLKPKNIIAEYLIILREPGFYTYALAGAFSFAGLFTFVAGSPIIFMDHFHVSAKFYGAIFATLAMGFIGGGQLNILLLKHLTSNQIFFRAVCIQVFIGVLFLLGTSLDWYGLYATLILFFPMLVCAGVSYPNAAAMALARFTRNAGSASALLGFLQFGVGAFISTFVGAFGNGGSLPIILIMASTSAVGLVILLVGRKRIIPGKPIPGEDGPDENGVPPPVLMH